MLQAPAKSTASNALTLWNILSRLDPVMIIKLHDKKLLKAAQKGDTDTVDELALEGASVNAADSVERTALWHAAAKGDTDMIEMLFHHHADPNRPDRDGITPLIAALEGGHFKAAAQLLERADIDLSLIHI